MNSIKYLFLLLLLLSLAACDDKKNNKTPSNSDQPTATIAFPMNGTITDLPTIVVRGSAEDSDGIDAVTVNGISAYVNGNKWWAEVGGLVEGDNTLRVNVTDGLNATTKAAATVTVNYFGPILDGISDFSYDSAGGKLYLLAYNTTSPIVEYDIATKTRRPVFAMSNKETYLYSHNSGGIELNDDGSQLFLVNQDRVFRINLATHSLEILSDKSSYNRFYSGMDDGFYYAANGTTIFLKNGVFVSIDAKGTATSVANTGIGDGECNEAAQRFTVDAGGTPARIYYSGVDTVYAMDVDGGNCAVLSGPGNTALGNNREPFILDIAGEQLLAYNSATSQIVTVSLSDGSRGVLNDGQTEPVNFTIAGVVDMKITAETDRRLLLLRPGAVDAINLVNTNLGISTTDITAFTGDSRIAVNGGTVYFQSGTEIRTINIDGEPPVDNLLMNITACGGHTNYNNSGFYFDDTTNRLVAFINEGIASDVNSISLADQSCKTVSSRVVGSTTLGFLDMAYDKNNNRILIANQTGQLIAVNPNDGSRDIIYNEGYPDDVLHPAAVVAGVVDSATDTMIASDRNGTVVSTSLADATLGSGTLLSDNENNNDLLLNNVSGLAAQSDETLLVSTQNQIIQVSRSDGHKTLLADNATNPALPPINMYGAPNKLAFYGGAASPGVYALQNNSDIMSIDLQNGQREMLNLTRTHDTDFNNGTVAYSKANNRVYYYDYNSQNFVYAQLQAPMVFARLADSVETNTPVALDSFRFLVASADGNYLYTVNNAYDKAGIVRINTATGDRVVISGWTNGTQEDSVLVGDGPEYSGLIDLALLANQIVVLQNDEVNGYDLIKVDLTAENGNRISVPLRGAQEDVVFSLSTSVAAGNRLFAMSDYNAINEIDPVSGLVSVFLPESIGDPAGLIAPDWAVYDDERNALLVFSSDPDQTLIEIPLDDPSERKSLISNNSDLDMYRTQSLVRQDDTIIFINTSWIGQYDLQSGNIAWLYFEYLPRYSCYYCD